MAFVEIVGTEYTEIMRKRLQGELPALTWLSQFAKLLRPLKRGTTLLDVGCGSGYAYETFKDEQIKYFGLDFEKEYMKIGQEKYFGNKHVEFIHHNITRSEIPVQAEVVICSATLEHCRELQPSLAYLLDAAKSVLLLRTFLGDNEQSHYFISPYRGRTKHINQYSFKKVLQFIESMGFKAKVYRDEYTDSIPQLVDGVMRTFYVIKAVKNDTER